MEKVKQYKPHGKHSNLTGGYPWGDAGQLILILRVYNAYSFHPSCTHLKIGKKIP